MFEPIFHRYGVDLYVGAHKHYYERLAPLYDGKLCTVGHGSAGSNARCTMYVVHGSAGNNEPISKRGTAHKEWIRGSNYINTGFLEFEVVNSKREYLRFIRASDGVVHDEGVLQKPPKEQARGGGRKAAAGGWGRGRRINPFARG